MAICFAFFLFNTPLAAQPNPDIIIIANNSFLGNIVSVNYSNVVDKNQVKKDVDELARLNNWKISNFETDTKAVKDISTTSAQFTVNGFICGNDGSMPVEQFIIPFKRLKNIQLLFMLPQTFVYNGIEKYEDNNIKIDMKRTGSTFQYNIAVKNSDFNNLNLPKTETEITKKTKADSAKHRMFVSFIIALIAAVAVFVVMKIFSGKSVSNLRGDNK